mmetsp:Transcript_20004/g.50763  ORF Transcript_20004/g.50763 Transcript_20004/m.50763 type:complete len:310 (+) Transcript_20004:53-982(+)
MGDSCCASYSMGAIKALIEEKLPGTYVHSIATGDGAMSDVWSSYFGNVNDQVAKVCLELRNTPQLARGYNAVGFSQGGQFLRAVVERCQHLGPRARTLVTLGAQHQGVANVPGCNTVPSNLTAHTRAAAAGSIKAAQGGAKAVGSGACETMQTLLGKGAYLPWVRDHIVQAQYFKDPARMDEYLRSNIFLPDINNEKAARNAQYARNLASLEQLVLYRFANDTTVVPRDSAWFALFDGTAVVALEDQPIYKEDWIGLRALDAAGKLVFAEAPGAHMQFTLDWFESDILWPYLSGDKPSSVAAAKASAAA